MKENVSPERLDTEQLIKLTCAKQSPVASMGFELLQQRDTSHPLSKSELLCLADTQCAVQTTTTTPWAIQRICEAGKSMIRNWLSISSTPCFGRPEPWHFKWLAEPNSPGFDDARLWAQLIESPFDDVKIELINPAGKTQARFTKKQHHASCLGFRDSGCAPR